MTCIRRLKFQVSQGHNKLITNTNYIVTHSFHPMVSNDLTNATILFWTSEENKYHKMN